MQMNPTSSGGGPMIYPFSHYLFMDPPNSGNSSSPAQHVTSASVEQIESTRPPIRDRSPNSPRPTIQTLPEEREETSNMSNRERILAERKKRRERQDQHEDALAALSVDENATLREIHVILSTGDLEAFKHECLKWAKQHGDATLLEDDECEDGLIRGSTVICRCASFPLALSISHEVSTILSNERPFTIKSQWNGESLVLDLSMRDNASRVVSTVVAASGLPISLTFPSRPNYVTWEYQSTRGLIFRSWPPCIEKKVHGGRLWWSCHPQSPVTHLYNGDGCDRHAGRLSSVIDHSQWLPLRHPPADCTIVSDY